jgi:hypothetical protein
MEYPMGCPTVYTGLNKLIFTCIKSNNSVSVQTPAQINKYAHLFLILPATLIYLVPAAELVTMQPFIAGVSLSLSPSLLGYAKDTQAGRDANLSPDF